MSRRDRDARIRRAFARGDWTCVERQGHTEAVARLGHLVRRAACRLAAGVQALFARSGLWSR